MSKIDYFDMNVERSYFDFEFWIVFGIFFIFLDYDKIIGQYKWGFSVRGSYVKMVRIVYFDGVVEMLIKNVKGFLN